VACGLCLDGCPYGLIYGATQTIPELARKGDFVYRGGILAKRFEEGMDGVTVHWRDIRSRERGSTTAERVFVGCGAVSTTALVLASLDKEGRELRL